MNEIITIKDAHIFIIHINKLKFGSILICNIPKNAFSRNTLSSKNECYLAELDLLGLRIIKYTSKPEN